MSKLADAIAANNTRQSGPTCTVGQLIPKLGKEHRADFDAAMANKAITAVAIKKGLKEETGLEVSEYALQRHRRGACMCR